VAGRHHLEGRAALLAADLAHHDVVGTLTERGLQQVELVDVALVVVGEGGASDGGDPVALGKLDLAGVLDRDDLGVRRDEQRDRVQARRLPGGGAAREDQALVVLDGATGRPSRRARTSSS